MNMIRFFTLNKKPRPHIIVALSVIAFIIVAFLMKDPVGNARYIHITFMIYLALMILLFMHHFFRQLQYNPYSYNSIYYIGFSLFLLVTLISQLQILKYYDVPEMGNEGILFSSLATLVSSGKSYMMLSAPFILFYSVCLCIANIVLIRKEGFSLTNILSIILSILLVGGDLFLFTVDYYVSGSQTEVMFHDLSTNLFASFYLYFECMLIGSIIVDIIVLRYRPDYDKDYIITLGCGLMEDGTPTPLLASRLNRALQFYHEQKQSTGKSARFITSGGQGADEVVAESTAMKNYLISKGIDEDDIIEENKSVNTRENMLFSKRIIDQDDPDSKVVFATSNFHVFRSGIQARRAKLTAEGIGAKTKWYFWPNATVREFVGLVSQHRLKQITILTVMILVYLFATYVLYMYI